MAVGAAWLKAWICENRKNRRHFRASPNESPTFMFLSEIIAMPQKCPFFFKRAATRHYVLCNHISSSRSVSFEAKKWVLLGPFWRAQHSIGRLIAPQCESHSPHDAASGYHWSKRHSLGGVNTPRTPPSTHEGGYAKMTKKSGFGGSPSRGARPHFL